MQVRSTIPATVMRQFAAGRLPAGALFLLARVDQSSSDWARGCQLDDGELGGDVMGADEVAAAVKRLLDLKLLIRQSRGGIRCLWTPWTNWGMAAGRHPAAD